MVNTPNGSGKVHPRGRADSSETFEKKTHAIVDKFSKAVPNRIMVFRVLLGLSLVLTGIVSGLMSYVLLRQREEDKYEADFQSISDEVFTTVNDGLKSKMLTLETMSTIMSYQCPDAIIWPNCSVPLQYFQQVMNSLVEVSKSRTLDASPIVRFDQKAGFEAFAYDFFEREGYPENTGISHFGKGIHAKYENGTRYPDDGRTPFPSHEIMLPVFQPAVIDAHWPAVMFNMHSEMVRAEAIDHVIDCADINNETQRSGSSIVQYCTSITQFIVLTVETVPSPFSLMFSPVFPLNDNTTLVGIITLVMEWTSILSSTGASYGKLDCVVEARRGGITAAIRHFELNSGTASYICDFFNKDAESHAAYDLSFGENDDTGTSYRLHFYTTPGFINQYYTFVPIFGSVVCAAIIIIISSLFIAYDILVKRESMKNQLLLDSKRIFVKFISHEIRTPINTVTLGLQLLSNRLSDLLVSDSVQQNCECGGKFYESSSKQLDHEMRLTEAVEECLDLVHDLSESSSTAVLVLNDLINYDKVQLKRFHIEKRLCNVYDVLKRTVQPQELLAKAQRVMLISPNFDGSAFLVGDEVKLGQVIRNVLSNALKFTPEGGTVTVTVNWDQSVPSDLPDHVSDIDPANGDKYEFAGILVIKVIDTGPGLSPDQQEQMFQEGVQFNPNELQGGQGSGLGLWISREIIQQHGGTIDVMSPGLGKGSTFTMSLPVMIPSISKSHASSCRHSMSHEEIERLSLLPLRVLVVDDSKVNARMLSRLLQNAGMKVSVVYSGEECIEYMSDSCNHDIEMIVMDFIMPIMSGPEAARILRASGHSIPIIGVTGNVLPEDIKCFKEAGANEVLVKPLILSKFLAVCKEVTLSGNNDDRFVSP